VRKKKQYSRRYNRIINYLKRSNDAMLTSLVLATAEGQHYPVGLKEYYDSLWAVSLVPGDNNKNAGNTRKSVLRRMMNSQELEVLKLVETSRLINQNTERDSNSSRSLVMGCS
jgi:hypothetical protein